MLPQRGSSVGSVGSCWVGATLLTWVRIPTVALGGRKNHIRDIQQNTRNEDLEKMQKIMEESLHKYLSSSLSLLTSFLTIWLEIESCGFDGKCFLGKFRGSSFLPKPKATLNSFRLDYFYVCPIHHFDENLSRDTAFIYRDFFSNARNG